MNQPLRILIADDHNVVREGARIMIEREPGWQVCGCAEHGRDAVEKALALRPDVVLLDLHMPELGGVEVVRAIRKQTSAIEFVVFSAERGERAIAELFETGVKSFIAKSDAAVLLIDAIKAAAERRPFFTAAVTRILFAKFMRPSAAKPEPAAATSGKLSGREREIVRLLAEGSSNKEIAGRLGISTRTAETHRANILRKLGVDSLAALVRYAIRNRMIEA